MENSAAFPDPTLLRPRGVAFSHDDALLNTITAATARAGADLHPHPLRNTHSVDQLRSLYASIVHPLGRLDVIVHLALHAGLGARELFFLSQAAHAHLKKQAGGRIIHVASTMAFIDLAHPYEYPLTRAGLTQLTKTMAVEWAKDNVQVNTLLVSPSPPNEPRPPDFEDLAASILLLSGSRHITGQTIVIDAGVGAGGSWE